MSYTSFGEYLKNRFGGKVYKISLSIKGLTCPNRNGKVGIGGCTFCLNGSGDFASGLALGKDFKETKAAVFESIEAGKMQTAKKAPDCHKFIAYFQSFTNTYAPCEALKPVFTAAACHPDIVALSIGTRPDCLPEDICEMLGEINKIKPVFVELGLQTSKDITAEIINRGYKTEVYIDAVKKLREREIDVVTHIIIGLPGESMFDYENSVITAVNAGTTGIKIQALNILEGTALAESYKNNAFESFKPLEFDEYIKIISRLVKLLPDNIVVHRLTGDGPKDALIAPRWCLNKRKVLNAIAKETKL